MGEANKLRENKVGTKGNRGRPKGSPNKTTAAVKDMILQALNEAHEDGGAAYLKEQAEKNPTAFLTLVGKVLPLDVNANHSGGVRVIHVPFPKSALDE
jgi:hypothetical protein